MNISLLVFYVIKAESDFLSISNVHLIKLRNIVIQQEVSVARAGQTRGAIGLSLIFCFFCIKAKEKKKQYAQIN